MSFKLSLRAAIPLLLLLLLLCIWLSTSAYSASGLVRLTTTGDLNAFEWSPQGDALFVTRAARTLALAPTPSQTVSDLYRVAVDNGALQPLAQNASFPAPAPNGGRVAFAALLDDGSARLRLLELAANQTRDLDAITWGVIPRWNAQGDRIIYALQGRGTTFTVADAQRQSLAPQTLPLEFAPSPDGTRIAYPADDGLHLLAGGRDIRIFAVNPPARVQTELRWSHDGMRIAFVVAARGLDPELWRVNADGSHATRLARGPLEYFSGLDWSPNDVHLIFTRTPTGSSIARASEIWRVAGDGSDLRALTHDDAEERAPKYSPDGTQIAFLRDGDVWLLKLDASGLPLPEGQATPLPPREIPPPPALGQFPSALTTQLTPPATIRVKHDPNGCRPNTPVGQIDVIDFETYVKRVVPAEVYPSWHAEALKTQAVAARSYAWFMVLLHTTWSYDVTDSTAYQQMCDTRYAPTDAAVDATRGQYGAYNGGIIFAAYGADNGDPTLTNTWGNPYLIAVDDPVGFRHARAGNGIGMSQWGAYSWATDYGWNYQQILTHYYTGIAIEVPAGGASDTTPPIGALVQPWAQWGVTSNRALVVANASDDAAGIASVDFDARYLDGANVVTTNLAHLTDAGAGWKYVWNLSAIPDQTAIVITPTVRDGNGNMFVGNALRFDLDRLAPTGFVSAPSATNAPTVTLTLNATDNRGVTQMAFGNDWIWEGENQAVENNSGAVVNDPDALNERALRGQVGVNPPGLWFGPYTTSLEWGKPYRAYLRLKTDNVTTTEEVALLDVVDNAGANVLGLKRLRGIDFRAANEYQEFYVDFDFTSVTTGLEFRVAYRAAASLWLDRILVVAYPVPYATSAQWTLSAGDGLKTVQVKFLDAAGNISPDAVAQIMRGATPTPTPTPTASPAATVTFTPPLTPTNTPAPTGTFTATATRTPTLTLTPSLTSTPSSTWTATPTRTATLSPTITPTRTATRTPTATPPLTPRIWLPFFLAW